MNQNYTASVQAFLRNFENYVLIGILIIETFYVSVEASISASSFFP
jgi:hypothetical protein